MRDTMNEAARALHDSLVVVDGHCDSALDMVGDSWGDEKRPPRDFLERGSSGHVDLPRLLEGGVTCQVMACFTDNRKVEDAAGFTSLLLDAIESAFARSDRLRLALSAADILAAKREGRVAALLAVEGGEAVGTSLDALRALYGRGLRLMTLTWSRRNAIGRGVGVPGEDGLSDFGREVVAEMERLGMIVDASHLSDEALDDLLAVARRPVVASHSNCRALCAHPRNLADAQIERIAATGGLVALTFAGLFVDPEPSKVSLGRFLEHVDRAVAIAGEEHVGIGSDFDGWMEKNGVVFRDCSELPRLTAALLDRGYSERRVAALMGGNWLRVIGEVVG